MREKKLDSLFERYARRPDVSELKFGLERPRRGWSYRWASPGSLPQHFIASSTKLFTLALVLRLEQQGLLRLSSRAAEYLPHSDLAGLNTHGGVDHWAEYSVEQLLSHTSGIPDYFEVAPAGEHSFVRRMLQRDFSWTYEDTLEQARKIPATFSPRPDKAVYSDTNYQLIGRLVETVTGRPFAGVLASEILEPLGLSHTFMFDAGTVERFTSISPMLHGETRVATPLAMTSFGVDGGMVSTVDDSMTFLKAFASAQLFPKKQLDHVTRRWNRVFPPLEYGTGIMRLRLSPLLTGFRRVPAMLGHSGASGHVMFWVPGEDLFVCGTVNQVKKRSLSYQLMVRAVMAAGS
jgi:CubicO group peptidase (beta-lactamase class C family)